MDYQYYVYILTNKHHTTLYTGITNNLVRRIYEHKNKLQPGFTRKYQIDKLVYYGIFNEAIEASAYEKKIKGWVRRKKDALISEFNAEWVDLYEEICR